MIGQSIAHFEITAKIGEGGMGEVYQATDTKLNREVALKILPQSFAQDPQRMGRFQREAQVLASLNHPNIAAIHGLEEANGTKALVMELVVGEDLSERIARGPIPLEEALPIALQVAEALEDAHEKGIIHRDLKPANIKLTSEGNVKVLDFGLAKAVEEERIRAEISNSPTLTLQATQAGIILGTAAYMSPEQARGKAVDKRADIWAFGCVLYEMLTGKRAFPGEDLTDILASVVKLDPDWRLVENDIPARIRQVLRICLQKDSRQRGGDIAAIRLALEGAFETEATAHADSEVTSRRSSKATLAAAIAVTGLIAGVLVWHFKPAPAQVPRVFQIDSGVGLEAPDVSPDGRRVVYVRDDKLVVRSLDALDGVELEGTDGASEPFWSPDGESIAYFAGRPGQLSVLRVISARGGPTRDLAEDVFAPFGGDWCEAGVVFSRWAQGLFVVPADGGPVLQFAPLDLDTEGTEGNLTSPHCLPDGRVLAVSRTPDELAATGLVVLDADRRVTLWDREPGWISDPVFVSPDSVLFSREDVTWRTEVSGDLSTVKGAPEPVLPAAGQLSLSDDGLLVMRAGTRSNADRRLIWVARDGQVLSEFGQPSGEFFRPALSPDGTRVAALHEGSLWVLRESRALQLADAVNGTIGRFAWSPDGEKIAYAITGSDPSAQEMTIVVRSSSGGGSALELQLPAGGQWRGLASVSWTPDGRYLVLGARYTDDLGWRGGAWLIELRKGASPEPLMEGSLDGVQVSPDGKFLAYASNETGAWEVFVTTFPNPGIRWPVTGGQTGRHPRWNPSGGELFYVSGPIVGSDPNSARDLYVVSIDSEAPDPVGDSKHLFDAESRGLRLTFRGSANYDVSPDGKRILVHTSGIEGTPVITAIDNIHAWLRQKR